MNLYKDKYLKYKNKYLNLKFQTGKGAVYDEISVIYNKFILETEPQQKKNVTKWNNKSYS